MGAGASATAPVDVDQAKKLAGEKFDDAAWEKLEKDDGKVSQESWNALVAAEAAKAEAPKTEAPKADIVKRCEDAYLNFRTGGKEGLALTEYWSSDVVFDPAFPVAGWEKKEGIDNVLAQFGAMANFPGMAGFAVMPTKFDKVGNTIYVHEEVKTKQCPEGFPGLAIHYFNDAGQCTRTTPMQDSAKMTARQYTGEKDLIAEVRAGYKAFGEGDMDTLSKMFHKDASMTPQFPVPGWEPKEGFEVFMKQFADMANTKNMKGFKPVPYDMKRDGNTVFVYEDISTDNSGAFKALAIFTFNDEGQVINCTPYHNSAQLTPK